MMLLATGRLAVTPVCLCVCDLCACVCDLCACVCDLCAWSLLKRGRQGPTP